MSSIWRRHTPRICCFSCNTEFCFEKKSLNKHPRFFAAFLSIRVVFETSECFFCVRCRMQSSRWKRGPKWQEPIVLPVPLLESHGWMRRKTEALQQDNGIVWSPSGSFPPKWEGKPSAMMVFVWPMLYHIWMKNVGRSTWLIEHGHLITNGVGEGSIRWN